VSDLSERFIELRAANSQYSLQIIEMRNKINQLEQENAKLKEMLKKAIASAEFFSKHADCTRDSWACKCEFCRNTSATIDLREAREYFKKWGE
jgi:predicted nuclease with TOPRIM domain